MNFAGKLADSGNRRSFIGGSDARVIMGESEAALLRLWRETQATVVLITHSLDETAMLADYQRMLSAAVVKLHAKWTERGGATWGDDAAGKPAG